MADHDQLFKTLLREFIALFLELFLPAWHALLDLSRVEWLEQELFPDPPEGGKISADLVARVATLQVVPPVRPGEEEANSVIVHLEVESEDSLTNLRPRLPDYHRHLRGRYHVPVLSAALYLRVALRGQGTDAYEESILGVRSRMEWPYIGLPGLDAELHVRGPNLLGAVLSVLMRIAPERRAWLAAEALQRIAVSQESGWRKRLLYKCVIAYGVTDGPQREAFLETIRQEPYREAETLMKTWFDEIREETQQKELRRFLKRQLETKFGPLNPVVNQRIDLLTVERIDQIGLELLGANSLDELGLGEEPLNGDDGAG